MTRALPLALAAVVAAAPFAIAQSVFRGNAAHTGVYDGPPPTLASTVWKFKTGGRVVSTPALAGGLVFVGSADGHLYALRASDGTVAWTFKTGLGVSSSPAVADGLIYFSSLDGKIYAVSADSGQARWTFATGGERRFTAPGIHGIQPAGEMMPDPFDLFLSSPVVTGGVLYVGSGDGHVYALDAATGVLKWKFSTGDVVHASPAVADGVVYIGSWDRYLYALSAPDGSVIWKFETGDDKEIHNQIGIASSAAVTHGVVLFGCRDGHFYAVDTKTGRKRWAEDNKRGWVIASPAVRDGTVYFPTSDGTQFKALSIATGALVWRTVNKAISFSSPAIVGDTIYFGTHDGWLHALDIRTGATKAEFQTDGNKQHAGVLIGDDGRMKSAAMFPDRTLDGTIVGRERMFTLGSILSSPVAADGVVYFGSTDGNVYAVR